MAPLSAAGLSVASHDTLAPAGAASISDGSEIALNRGRVFTVTIDGKKQQIWTTARTVDQALAEIGRNPADYQLSANRSRQIPLGGLQVTAATLHTVSLAGSHVKAASVTSPARTVGALLDAQGVKLGKNDRVSPALGTALTDGVTVTVRTLPTVVIADGAGKAISKVSDVKTVRDLLRAQNIKVGKLDVVHPALDTALVQGLKITITRVGYSLVTKTITVPQPADQTVEDDQMDKGTSDVTQQGQAGVRAGHLSGQDRQRQGRHAAGAVPQDHQDGAGHHHPRGHLRRPGRGAGSHPGGRVIEFQLDVSSSSVRRPAARLPPPPRLPAVRASIGMPSPIANRPTTGRSIRVTAITAGCSSTRARG